MQRVRYLQSLTQSLVQPGDLAGDGQVKGLVANLDNQTTQDLWRDHAVDLKGLAVTNERRFLDGSLQSLQSLVVQWLGRSDSGLNDTLVGLVQRAKVLVDVVELSQSVVLRQNAQEVVHGLVQRQRLGDGVNDGLSVVTVQSWVGQELGNLLVLLDQVSDLGQSLVGRVNRGLLHGSRVQGIGVGSVDTEQLHWRLSGLGSGGHGTGKNTGSQH